MSTNTSYSFPSEPTQYIYVNADTGNVSYGGYVTGATTATTTVSEPFYGPYSPYKIWTTDNTNPMNIPTPVSPQYPVWKETVYPLEWGKIEINKDVYNGSVEETLELIKKISSSSVEEKKGEPTKKATPIKAKRDKKPSRFELIEPSEI